MTKPIPRFEAYSATSCGKIVSQSGKVMKPFSDQHGYLRIYLSKNGKCFRFYVQVLIMATFEGWDPSREVNHKNKDREKNYLPNLEYLTRKENMWHKSKLDKRIVERIRFIDGKVQLGFWKKLANALNVKPGSLYDVRKYNTWNI